MAPAHRRTIDLSQYPDLVVIYLGMRVHSFAGLKTLVGLWPQDFRRRCGQARWSLVARADHLLSVSLASGHASILARLPVPRNLVPLRAASPLVAKFLSDTGGAGFWHETYFIRGGFEAVYDDIPAPLGLTAFAPSVPAHGAMFSARKRLKVGGEPVLADPVPEQSGRDVQPNTSNRI